MDLSRKVLYIVGAGSVRYGELAIKHRGGTRTLDEWLAKEQADVSELARRTQLVEDRIHPAHRIIDELSPQLQTEKGVAALDHLMSGKHGYAAILDELGSDLLGPACGRHSPQAQSFIRLGINYLLRSHRKFSRKSGSPYAVHPFMAASIAAQEGADFPTVIAAMLHDRVEESIASYTKHLDIREERSRQRAIDDRASGILYTTGLYFYEQVRRFTFPERYFADINSLLDIVDKLSRTRDQTYYEYLQKLFYPKVPKRRRILRGALFSSLDFEMQCAIGLFDGLRDRCGNGLVRAFLRDIDSYYTTHLGRDADKPGPEEMQLDMYRSMIVKLADRIHNTRDMDPTCFSVPKRLYGLGFKNAYFVQELERKLLRQKYRSIDMGTCVDLIMDLRLATLWQLLNDERRLRQELGEDVAKDIEFVVEVYKGSSAFRQITPASRGGPLDGMLEQYNAKAHGDPGIFETLQGSLKLQYLHVLTFRSLFENYLAYAAGKGPEQRFFVSNFGLGFAFNGRKRRVSFETTTLRRIVV